MDIIKNIEKKINQLNNQDIIELDNFLDKLINDGIKKKPKKLKLDWAGGLRDVKISSIELQKKAIDWRAE